MKKYQTIDEYIENFPSHTRRALSQVRSVIAKVAPRAQEEIKYGIPTFTLEGNLIHFAAYEHHLGLYPGASGIAAFKDQLQKYVISKGTVQFPLNASLPQSLIRQIVVFRLNENIALAKERALKKKQHLEFHRDGSIMAKGKILAGKPEGYWEWFRTDGTKLRSGYFTHGEQTGIWTTYTKDGAAHKVTEIKVSPFPKLGAPALRALASAKIASLRDLSRWREEDLLKLHGIGKTALPPLRAALKAQKLSFKK